MRSLIRKEILRPLRLDEAKEVIEQDEDEREEKLLAKSPDNEAVKKESKEELEEKDIKLPYGKEVIFDIHSVKKEIITVEKIKTFAGNLCDEIGMTRGIKAIVWGTDSDKDELKDPRADGLSAIQFLHSSSITIHAIDSLNRVFINIFSCKEFSTKKAKDFCSKTWGGEIVSEHVIIRK